MFELYCRDDLGQGGGQVSQAMSHEQHCLFRPATEQISNSARLFYGQGFDRTALGDVKVRVES